MAQPTRNIWLQILKNFVASLRPRKVRGDLVGKDHFGTSYYQLNGEGKQKDERWFDPKEKDNFEQEIPAEWESWLRYRRKVPPLEEEVLANYELAKQKKLNALKLEAQRNPKLLDGEVKREVKGMESFPKYEEYEITPGVKKRKDST